MAYNIFKYRKNFNYFFDICAKTIDSYQQHPTKLSCKEDVINIIKRTFEGAKQEIAEWDNIKSECERSINGHLAQVTFDLLASGKYHLYYGVLNPMSCADNLLDVYRASMDYALRIGEITEDIQKEQYELLMSCISKVG